MIGMNHSHAQVLTILSFYTTERLYTTELQYKGLVWKRQPSCKLSFKFFFLKTHFSFSLKDNLAITSVLPPSHSSGPTQSGALTSALTGQFTTVVYTIISFSSSLTNLSLPLKSTFLSCPSWVSVPACLGIYQITEEGGEGRKKQENFPSKEILISRLLLLGVKICIDY